MSKSDENTLALWERKIYGSVKLNGLLENRTNEELKDRYRETDIISEIRKGRLKWCGKNARRTLKEMFNNIAQGKCQLESQETDGWTMLKIS